LWIAEIPHKAIKAFSSSLSSAEENVIVFVTSQPTLISCESSFDDFVKSRNQTAKKKDPDARRANPEE